MRSGVLCFRRKSSMSLYVGFNCKGLTCKRFICLPLQRIHGAAVAYVVAGDYSCTHCGEVHSYSNQDAVDEDGNSLAEV
jgi:hypothetical protein